MQTSDLAGVIRRTQRQSLGDLLWRSARRVPTRMALSCRDRSFTYAELDTAVNYAANHLASRGVRKGDRVALLSHNNYEFVVMHFAIARLGAILVPINFMLNAAEVAYILDHSEAVGLIVEDALLQTALSALEGLNLRLAVRAVITDRAETIADDWQNVNNWINAGDGTVPDIDLAEDEPVHIMYTSGTESRPKGATLSTRNLVAQYVSCIIGGEMSAEDIEIHALPLFHCAQLHCFLMPGLYLGAKNFLLPGADPTLILEMIEREGATKLFCPPTVWISLLRHPDFERRDLTSLIKGYYGASIMPVEIVKELARRLPQLRLFNFYGQTEMSPNACVLKPEDQMRKLGAAGRPVVNVETGIVDEDDRPVPAGVVGEIVHRGPQVMMGYWKDPQRTAEAFRNGWFHSGDLGVMDEEGYLTVVDRKKDMIKTGGENVASREVEEIIYQHPAVAEAAVIGMPDPKWIERVTAVVVLRAGSVLTEDALIAHCRQRMAAFKTPKSVIFLPDLPRNASGKLLKRELRQLLAIRD